MRKIWQNECCIVPHAISLVWFDEAVPFYRTSYNELVSLQTWCECEHNLSLPRHEIFHDQQFRTYKRNPAQMSHQCESFTSHAIEQSRAKRQLLPKKSLRFCCQSLHLVLLSAPLSCTIFRWFGFLVAGAWPPGEKAKKK